MVDILVFSLNTLNSEKVNAKVMQSSKGQNWFSDSELNKHYSVQCKIYPFPNKVCSVRIVIARIYKNLSKQEEKQEEQKNESPKVRNEATGKFLEVIQEKEEEKPVKPKKQKNLVVKFVSDVKKVNNIFRTRK